MLCDGGPEKRYTTVTIFSLIKCLLLYKVGISLVARIAFVYYNVVLHSMKIFHPGQYSLITLLSRITGNCCLRKGL